MYEYDDRGRVVRAVEHREPEFDPDEQAALIAFARHENDIGPHGHLMSEALDPGANPNDYKNPLGFVPLPPVIDWVEKTRLDKIDAVKKEFGDDFNFNGWIFPVGKAPLPDN